MEKSTVISIALTAIITTVVILIAIFKATPGIMLMEDESRYGFDETVSRFETAVLEAGWKIPAVHDLQQVMRNNNKPEVLPVKVFELCHPDHAHLILSRDAERVVSSLMPCRVSIYEHSDGRVFISRMNSGLMGSMMKGVVPKVMKEAAHETEEILKPLLK